MDLKWLQMQFSDLTNFIALAPSGQKEVFAADHKTDGAVVLKIFKPGSEAERIEREMQTPLKVKSLRVPMVYESGRTASPTGEIVWFREKKIEGQSLREVLDAKGKVDTATTIRIGLHVIDVLATAEVAAVVHRDIKPGNIIIATDGSAWVIDFGIARHLDEVSLTPTLNKLAACTPGYAPVEQFTNQKRDIDARADLFATGVTLYECIEGENPFVTGATTPGEKFDRVAHIKLPRIGTSGVPGEFIDLVEAMTRTKAEHRPATAAEALQWIEEIATAHSII